MSSAETTPRGRTAAQAVSDAERVLRYRGIARVDSSAMRLMDAVNRLLNHQWRWDNVHTDEQRIDIASKGSAIAG